MTYEGRLALVRINPWAMPLEPADVRADERGLAIGGELHPRSSFRAGYVLQRRGAIVVRLERRFFYPLELVAPSVAEARAVLRALGFDSTQLVSHHVTLGRFQRYVGGILGVAMFSVPVLIWTAWTTMSIVAPLIAVALFLLAAIVPSRVDVAPDGVRYRWLGWRTFVPTRRIRSVLRQEMAGSKGHVRLDLSLTLDDGSQLLIPVGSRDFAESRAAVLYERIREIVDDRAPEGSPPPVLARGGKTAREWITSLRALGRERSYRAASVDEAELARVVETATMSAEERAAAAVALARDDAGRERVRIAASAVVAPHLRVALDAVASGDDDALESAMEALAKGDSV